MGDYGYVHFTLGNTHMRPKLFKTTLNIVFSVTYYLTLRNIIIV